MKPRSWHWRVDGRMKKGRGAWKLAGYFGSRYDAERWCAELEAELAKVSPGTRAKCWAETRVVEEAA